jgi:hypothetical protein
MKWQQNEGTCPEHRKTHDFINKKGSFDRENLVAL